MIGQNFNPATGVGPRASKMLLASLLSICLMACGYSEDSLTSPASGAESAESEKSASTTGDPVQVAGTDANAGKSADSPPASQTAADGSSAATPAPAAAAAPAAATPSGSDAVAESIFMVQTLIDDMSLPNDNNWWLSVNGDMTANKNGPNVGSGNTWAYVTHGIRAADAQSYWPKRYLDSSFGFSGSQSIRRLGWFVIARAAQAQPSATNTRVQTRNFKNLVLFRNGNWEVAGESSIGLPYPANWHADFSSPGNETVQSITSGSGVSQARAEASGGVSIGSVGAGDRASWAIHGWPASREMSQSTWVNDVVGVVTFFEARLILHDASQADDRADANLLVWTGADWYANGYVGEHSHGRLKLVKNDWRIFSTTDIPASVLKANPPPGFSN